MKNFITAVIFAVFGILVMEISNGDSFCLAKKPQLIGDNSTCSNTTGLSLTGCQLKCIFCYPSNTSEPYGCISNNKTCQCIAKKNATTTTTTTTPLTTTLPSSTEAPTLPPTGSPIGPPTEAPTTPTVPPTEAPSITIPPSGQPQIP